ncbi:MAG: hypothetical protein IPM36_24335 [Lewinellaceae bacterium]|nr:hypothetical protein [Lewinellaceae bacterium]
MKFFRSERALALLLRWHVNAPGSVVVTNVSDTIKTIYHFARSNQVALSGINVDNWINDETRYLISGAIATPEQIADDSIKKYLRRQNLALTPSISGTLFNAPENWAATAGNNGLPNQASEENFCRAIILYIRLHGSGPMKTSMGLVYYDVPGTAQNFVMDEDGL